MVGEKSVANLGGWHPQVYRVYIHERFQKYPQTHFAFLAKNPHAEHGFVIVFPDTLPQ